MLRFTTLALPAFCSLIPLLPAAETPPAPAPAQAAPAPEDAAATQEELKKNRSYQSGLAALQKNLASQAVIQFDKALKTKDMSDAAREQIILRLAEAYVRNDKAAEAIALYAALPDGKSPAYWSGLAFAKAGRYVEAEPLLASIPAEDPLYGAALQALAYVSRQAGDQDVLADTLQRMIALDDKELKTKAQLALAEQKLDNGDLKDVQPLLDAVLKAEETDKLAASLRPVATLLDIRKETALKNYDRAEKLCNELIDTKGNTDFIKDSAKLEKACIRISRAKNQPAPSAAADDADISDNNGAGEQTIRQFIDSTPNSTLLPEAFAILKANDAFALDPTMMAKLHEWEKSKNTNLGPIARLHLAEQNYLRNNREDALALVRKGIEAAPRHAATQNLLLMGVQWLISDGKVDEAKKLMDKSSMNTARALFQRGYIAYREGRYAEAEAAFSEARSLANDSQMAATTMNTALAALMDGHTTQADALAKAEKNDPELYARLQYQRAHFLAHYKPEDARKALESFIKTYDTPPAPSDTNGSATPEVKPPSPAIRHDVARAHMDLVQLLRSSSPRRARTYMERLDGMDASDWDKNLIRRRALLRIALEEAQTQYPEAIAATRKALQEINDPEAAAALHLKLGDLLYRSERYGDALQSLTTFMESYPESPLRDAATFLAGKAAAKVTTSSSLAAAADLFRECVARRGNYAPAAAIERASIFKRMGKIQEALNELSDEFIATLKPGDKALALSTKADAWQTLAEKDPAALTKARDLCTQLLELTDLPLAWTFRGLAQRAQYAEKAGDTESALADYQQIMAHDPSALESAPRQHWYWYYLSGFSSIHLLEQQGNHIAALAIANALANTSGPRAQDAANLARRIRLENFIWDDSRTLLKERPATEEKQPAANPETNGETPIAEPVPDGQP